VVEVDDPWGHGNSLEWATSSPPPLRNFDRMPRIRSERPAFDAKYGRLVADLGRDLPQRTTKPPQSLAEELHHERHLPESPAAEGAHGAREAVEYQPAPQSGARPVDVPEPEEVRRPSFDATDEPEVGGLGAERAPQENERWRHPHSRGDSTER
jgi:cytochrome c oxidase subunit 1